MTNFKEFRQKKKEKKENWEEKKRMKAYDKKIRQSFNYKTYN